MKADELTPEQLAERWELSIITLQQWRWRGVGPRFSKIGRKIKYSVEDVRAFEKQKLRYNTSRSKTYALSSAD